MRIVIKFSEETSPLFIKDNDEYTESVIKYATQMVNDTIRYSGYATYEFAMTTFGILPDRQLLACGWLTPDVFAVNPVKNDDGSYNLEIECREDIRFI